MRITPFSCFAVHFVLYTAIGLLTLGGPGSRANASGLGAPITSWIINTTCVTGSSPNPAINGVMSQIPADVQSVWYDSAYAYVKATGIPSYPIGPFPGDPNVPGNQNFTFRIPRFPQAQMSAKTPTGLGPIGVLSNGVALFNPLDANSYQNLGIWHQNAPVVEASSFDAALGHPAPGMGPGGAGIYHHHQYSPALGAKLGDTGMHHSPIIGFAFDGFPIYGPFGFANVDGTGGIARMRTGYRLRSITKRMTLPDGTALQPNQYGPDVSAQYPLGTYVEDFIFTMGTGDLDPSNGRFCVTPDYPQGTYAYFSTTDASGNNVYPYLVGPTYYGVVDTVNTNHSVITIPVGAVQYNPSSVPVIADFNADGKTDLVWQNDAAGDAVVWYMNGPQWSGSYDYLARGVTLDWKLIGTADLTQDGNPDLLWQNQVNGDVSYWRMNGSNFVSGDYITRGVSTDWKIVSTADLNGDGKPDLIWQNVKTGDVAYWLMNGTVWNGAADFIAHNIPTEWQIRGSADLNGDGKPDLIWQNTRTGDAVVWYMNGLFWTGAYDYLAHNLPTEWKIVSAADYNGDGKPDLIWQNTKTGDTVVWAMNGPVWTGTFSYIAHNLPTQWRIVAPQ